eukprot:5215791-Prymnesium_polylepis.1
MKPPQYFWSYVLPEAAIVAARVESALYKTIRAAATPLQRRKSFGPLPRKRPQRSHVRADAPPPRSRGQTT